MVVRISHRQWPELGLARADPTRTGGRRAARRRRPARDHRRLGGCDVRLAPMPARSDAHASVIECNQPARLVPRHCRSLVAACLLACVLGGRLRQWGLRFRRIEGLGRAGIGTGPTTGIVLGPRGAVGGPRYTRPGLTALATIPATPRRRAMPGRRWPARQHVVVGARSRPCPRRRSVPGLFAGGVRRRSRRRSGPRRPTLPWRLGQATRARARVEELCVAGTWTARPCGARGRMARWDVAGLGPRLGG
jgi:hypothetical protein